MSIAEFLSDEELATDVVREDGRLVARRQFVGSLAVALVIAVAAASMALAPNSGNHAAAAPKFAQVRQPTFVHLPDQGVASFRQGQVEYP